MSCVYSTILYYYTSSIQIKKFKYQKKKKLAHIYQKIYLAIGEINFYLLLKLGDSLTSFIRLYNLISVICIEKSKEVFTKFCY